MTHPVAATLRIGWGTLLLVRARPLLTSAGGKAPPERAVVIARVLAARQLLQGAVVLALPRPAVIRLSARVDAAHSLTAVALAVADRRWAKLALGDAAIAAAWSLSGRRALASTGG